MIKALPPLPPSFLSQEVRGREKAAAAPGTLPPPEKSALGEGRGARGEGTPLPREARGFPSPQQTVPVVCCPLPLTDSACRALTAMLAAELSPLLSSAQRAHLEAFRQPRAACSRWLSRLALAACLTIAGAAPGLWLPLLERRSSGGPGLRDWAVCFCHSEQAAFAALLPAADENVRVGLDAEALSSLPPAEAAFEGLPRTLPLTCRERLRRWTLKESLVKAAGTGLACPPARIPDGRHGQRRGSLRWRERTFFWQTLPLPGHWLALTSTRPVRPVVRLLSPLLPADRICGTLRPCRAFIL